MYEVLRKIQNDMTSMKMDVGEIKVELNSIRGHVVSVQQDINNVYSILARHDQRLDRIERRLELRELAEGGVAYDPAR